MLLVAGFAADIDFSLADMGRPVAEKVAMLVSTGSGGGSSVSYQGLTKSG
ncbi:hypothetical protein [Ferrovibrio sp.]